MTGRFERPEDVEFATLEWVSWYNTKRLLGPIGYLPPIEFEEAFYRRQQVPEELATLT
jgi:transposase InsO family protein